MRRKTHRGALPQKSPDPVGFIEPSLVGGIAAEFRSVDLSAIKVGHRRAKKVSGLSHRILREDFLYPLERFLCRGLGRRLVLNDFGPGCLPNMLVLDLGISRV
jgi:hypothetical protein